MFGRRAAGAAALFCTLLSACVAPQAPAPAPNASGLAAARDLAADPREWANACSDWDEWDKPAPPFRVHGDTYHVGTCGITAVLVAGPRGHVLIDTGTRNGSVEVLENIRTLGFYQENVRAILTSHEHHDHVGGAFWAAQNTGAQVHASPAAAAVLRTGRSAEDDPQHGMHGAMDPVPAQLIRTVEPGKPMTVAGLTFVPIATPGHTPGALSWQWESCEGGQCRTIVYADSLTPVSRDDYRFTDHPQFLAAYRSALARLAALDCDILLTPHPSASGMRDKIAGRDFAAPPTCRAYADALSARIDARIAEERDGR